MSHLALKDLFSNFFVIEEEEDEVADNQQQSKTKRAQAEPEAERPTQQDSYYEPTQQQQSSQQSNNHQYNERQRAIKAVPKRQTQSNRLQSSSNERKYQPMNESTARNVVNMNASNLHESSKMCLFEPRVFSDTQDIADELKNRRATLVNLQRIDNVSAKRIIDFLSGTVYAIGGDIQRVGNDIFLCTPDNVEVAGSITEDMESTEYDYE
ncbi:cell division protein SepF [Staphylococcus carnosus]|uniref:cell division protein SepF n=1 Tax=Staphylococcus carnosus TaxID=1281 RepID=UPI003530CE3D